MEIKTQASKTCQNSTPKTAKLGMKHTWLHGDFAAAWLWCPVWCALGRFGAFTGLTTEPRLTYVL
jgi:hypothetical protein